jgi:uncharacterized protein (TIGR00730 family)
MVEHAPPTDERRALRREDPHLEHHLQGYLEEFRRGFEAVSRLDRPGVGVFGSARTPEGGPWWDEAVAVGAGFAREGFGVVTGGGPGLMAAANKGAQEAGGPSIGFGIALPHQQRMNGWVDDGVTFDHFYARKVMFVKASEGFVVFPGGFGTLDELYEALVLIQTGKIQHFPVVLFGRPYWEPVLRWHIARLLDGGYVTEDDLDLVSITDEPAGAVRIVAECYREECAHVAHPSEPKES